MATQTNTKKMFQMEVVVMSVFCYFAFVVLEKTIDLSVLCILNPHLV